MRRIFARLPPDRRLGAAQADYQPASNYGLNNQSNRLSGLGRREEALAAINEAVTIRRLCDGRPSIGDTICTCDEHAVLVSRDRGDPVHLPVRLHVVAAHHCERRDAAAPPQQQRADDIGEGGRAPVRRLGIPALRDRQGDDVRRWGRRLLDDRLRIVGRVQVVDDRRDLTCPTITSASRSTSVYRKSCATSASRIATSPGRRPTPQIAHSGADPSLRSQSMYIA
jgi:hypothetical protein